MTQYTANWHYKLIINTDEMVEGVEVFYTSVSICKKCHYAKVDERHEVVKLPVKLPKALIYALAEELLSYIYHKL